jgi:voltage-gated potassium channel
VIDAMTRKSANVRRYRSYELLEQGAVGSRASRLVEAVIILLIGISLFAVALETVQAIAARYHTLFVAIEIVALVTFTLEYGLRLWVAVEYPLYRHLPPGRAHLTYATRVPAIIDLLAVLPFWFAWVLPQEFQILLLFRVIRFLKLGRYSPAIQSLLDALYAGRRALVGCFIILIGAALMMATLMHVVEGTGHPDKFGTIPDAMWWAITTLGTIGYGDVVPITPLGRMLATATIFLGLIMVALPEGIVATAFASDIHRREFIVTWGIVARVPLFAGLDAKQIAEIMRLLQSQRIEAGGVIIRRGEPAHSMYFVAAGEVEVALPGTRYPSGRGPFLRRDRRTSQGATVGHRAGGHPDEPDRSRCSRRPRAHGSGAQDSKAYSGDGARTDDCLYSMRSASHREPYQWKSIRRTEGPHEHTPVEVLQGEILSYCLILPSASNCLR